MNPIATAPERLASGEAELDLLLAQIEACEHRIRAQQALQLSIIEHARLLAESHAPGPLATRSFVAEIATALVVPEGTAGRLVTTAGRLAEHPSTSAALASGEIGLAHAESLLEAIEALPEPAAEQFEDAALDGAWRLTAPAFRRRVRRLLDRLHPEPLAERRARSAADRRVCVEPAADGMAWLSVFLPAEQAVAIDARLRASAARTADDEKSAPRGDAPSRTRAQIAADLAASLLLGSPDQVVADSPIGAVVPRVVVTVPVMSLLGVTDEPADLDGYGPIDADTARRLAAHAPSFQRILTHPETGAFRSYGRTSYRVPADLAGMLRVRDGGCRFPGCGRRASAGLDLDHTRAWADGGETAADNLAYLCRAHHRLKHEAGWQVVQAPGGSLTWTSPAGRTHRTDPEQRIGPVAPPRPDYPDEPPWAVR